MREFLTGLLVSAAMGVYAQQECYRLHDFQIFPKEKAVYRWSDDASAFEPDKRINYNTTELVFIASGVTFKEYTEDFDLPSFKVLRQGADSFRDLLFVDKDGLYRDFYPEESGYRSMSELSGKVMLAERVYMNPEDKTIFFIDLIGDELIELENVPSGFDFNTLKPVCDNFFYNKDGLYVFGHTFAENGSHDTNSSVNLLKSSNGKQIIPEVSEYYLVYNGDVYARNQCDAVKKLKLNPRKVTDLSEIIHPGLLSDGIVTYSKFYETDSEGLEKVAEWKIIAETGEYNFIADGEKKIIFMPSTISVPITKMDIAIASIIWDGEKYLGITRESLITTYKSLQIYNFKTKKHEELDWKKYNRMGYGLYVYDGILVRDGVPVKNQEVLKVNNLRPLVTNNSLPMFYTDGSHILCMDANNTILKDVDMKTLRVINNELIVDSNRIYTFHIGDFNVIPYRELGIRIRVVEEKS